MKTYYCEQAGLDRKNEEVFWNMALIRLMQNLGVFKVLSGDQPFFKSKIQPAEERLRFLEPKINLQSRDLIFDSIRNAMAISSDNKENPDLV